MNLMIPNFDPIHKIKLTNRISAFGHLGLGVDFAYPLREFHNCEALFHSLCCITQFGVTYPPSVTRVPSHCRIETLKLNWIHCKKMLTITRKQMGTASLSFNGAGEEEDGFVVCDG
ncbi:hypothetical protein NE237_024263 [Protea cynaroides]|uniref:Uncharacterized protein n=1 Tax=Protea cynaroides TaxID=273540 RepID=A0A9Q0K593_9MAGN|nr:hypothetical protein NE237_024263 [Protea cynaroides]